MLNFTQVQNSFSSLITSSFSYIPKSQGITAKHDDLKKAHAKTRHETFLSAKVSGFSQMRWISKAEKRDINFKSFSVVGHWLTTNCSNTHLAQLQHFFDNTSTPTRIIYISSSIFVFFLAVRYLNLGLTRSESPWILKCKQLQFIAVK